MVAGDLLLPQTAVMSHGHRVEYNEAYARPDGVLALQEHHRIAVGAMYSIMKLIERFALAFELSKGGRLRQDSS